LPTMVNPTLKFLINSIFWAATFFSTASLSTGAAPPPHPGKSYPVFSDDGAWCWFQDPRAVYVEGKHKQTFAGWMTHTGRLQIGAYDHQSGDFRTFTLKDQWDIDDHNTCSILVLPDKRLMVFYARHCRPGLFCRTTAKPEDISQWQNEITVTDALSVTYSHPVYLTAESRFYVFWRGSSSKPTFASSADGKTWTPPRILIQQIGREDPKIRPYLKVVSDGTSTIHFAFTDDHPRDEPQNSIYYLRYENGSFFKADGSRIADLTSLPISPVNCDLVYNAKPTSVRSWLWDIALDKQSRPVIAYTRLPKETDHRYHYACWTGDRWLDTQMTPAGRWFPQTPAGQEETEPHYSAGLVLDHSNPSIVYLSRPINSVFEIEKWTTPDNGRTWAVNPITCDSKYFNVRPVVPRGYSGGDLVLWMHGQYIHYTNYQTDIRMLTPTSAVAPQHTPSPTPTN